MPASTGAPERAGPPLRPAFHWMVLFIVLAAWNYGYGISELNALQIAFTCSNKSSAVTRRSACLGMTESQFGYVTALFTVGGLLGSLSLSTVAQRFHFGPRRSIFLSALFNALGGTIIALAGGAASAGLGRFVRGLGAGISVVCVPVYLR